MMEIEPNTNNDAFIAPPTNVDYTEWIQLESELAAFTKQINEGRKTGVQDPFCQHSIISGDLPKNQDRNRYRNVKPLERTRVKLKGCDSDYINGNWIAGPNTKDVYIATQAPLPSTFADFWLVVWQEQCLVIVMLTNLQEKGTKKADRYWPQGQVPLICGRFEITLVAERNFVASSDLTREFRLRNLDTNEIRPVYQLHINWPDMGVPSNKSMLSILDCINSFSAGQRPLIVHCSAGLGRAGTFILIHTMLHLALENHIPYGKLDFMWVLQCLRQQRHGVVQTWDQYLFAKRFVQFYLDVKSDQNEFEENMRNEKRKWLQVPNPEIQTKRRKIDAL
jgi:protein tyrosine phosphatase